MDGFSDTGSIPVVSIKGFLDRKVGKASFCKQSSRGELMKIKEVSYGCFNEFFQKEIYDGVITKFRGDYIFRGQPTNEWKLTPSALRIDNKGKLFRGHEPIADQWDTEEWQTRAELQLLIDFYKSANNSGLAIPYSERISKYYLNMFSGLDFDISPVGHIWPPTELTHLAALAQHYGVITRLLDWTQDIFVSLYFASKDAISRGGCATDNGESCKRQWQGDTIVVWAIWSSQIQFLSRTTSAIPLKFIVPPYNENPNLNAQKGVLSYWEIYIESTLEKMNKYPNGDFYLTRTNRQSLDELLQPYLQNESDEFVVLYKFNIPVTECCKIYEKVKQFGYSASTLFPGYYGVARQLEEDVSFYKLSEKLR